MELTVAVLGSTSDLDKFRPLLHELNSQTMGLPVEIFCLLDNDAHTMSRRRNDCLQHAQGKYIAFVDGGDRLNHNYIDCLLAAIKNNPGVDLINFHYQIDYPQGHKNKFCSLRYDECDTDCNFYGPPDLFMCYRTDLARQVPFWSFSKGDDSYWPWRMMNFLKTETTINNPIYFRNLRASGGMPLEPPKPLLPTRDVDVIILSYGKTQQLRDLTQACLDSLHQSEDQGISFHPLVLESNKEIKPFGYRGCRTHYPDEEFNYSAYSNIGLGMTNSKYVCICNNDVSFFHYWATEQIAVMDECRDIMSTSAYCPSISPRFNIEFNSGLIFGYEVIRVVTGWCILHRREIFDIIGPYDPQFSFWFVDNDYGLRLKKHNLAHCLVTSAVVDHTEGGRQTLANLDSQSVEQMTVHQREKLKKKWRRVWLSPLQLPDEAVQSPEQSLRAIAAAQAVEESQDTTA